MCYRLLICLLFFSHLLKAQQFNFTHIGTDQGIPSSEVFCVLQDNKGYMWFGTNSGVCRYNGKKFTTYTTAHGLTDNTVLTMCEDHEGRIWFGPQNNEFCYWYKDSIYTIPAGNTFSKKLAHGGVYFLGMYADSGNNIWLSTNQGLYVSELSKNYAVKKTQPDDSCITLIRIIDGKKSLVSNQPSIRSKSAYSNPFIGYETPSGTRYAAIKYSKSNGALVQRTVLLKDRRILYAFGKQLYIFYPGGRLEIKKFDKSIITLNDDRENGLWIGFFKGGLHYYKNQDLNTTPVRVLEKYSVGNVFKDHEGGVWVTTIDRGIFYAPSTSILIYPDISGLDDHIVFLGALNNKVIVSTFGGNIFEIDSLLGIRPAADLIRIRNDFGRLSVLKAIDDTVYAGFGGTVFVKNRSLKKSISVYSQAFPKNLIEGDDKRIWCLQGGGIVLLDKYNSLRNTTYMFPFRLTCGIAEKDSGLYIGTKSGLYLFKNGQFTSMDTFDPILKSPIIQIKKDKLGYVWLATIGSGILIMKDKKVVKKIDSKNGLVSDICNAIEIDGYGNVWVGTPRGLSCIKKGVMHLNKYDIKNIRKTNGLNSDEITTLYAHDSTLWVGTMNGISNVNINQSISNNIPSPVYLKSVQVNNMFVDTNHPVFSYKHNNLRIAVEGLSFSNEPNRIYRYKLKGFDTSWRKTTTDIIELNNLSPGGYTFFAQVLSGQGTWSKDPAVFHFTIQQPFWWRWWFILLEIAILALAIHFFIRTRTRIITKREEEKTRINKLLAEYQMKALRAQMNPHFIFNAINSIQNFILQRDSMHAYDYLTKFSRLIRLVLINTKENEMTIKQEIEILSLYIELEQLRFDHAFELKLHVDAEIEVDQVVIPALLIQPYVENAIWHGLMPLKTRKGILDISIRRVMETIKITIKDNGLGRERSSQIKKKIAHQSMGLDLNNKRVELFGQDSGIAQIIIEDIYDPAGEPGGTHVEIILPLVESY